MRWVWFRHRFRLHSMVKSVRGIPLPLPKDARVVRNVNDEVVVVDKDGFSDGRSKKRKRRSASQSLSA